MLVRQKFSHTYPTAPSDPKILLHVQMEVGLSIKTHRFLVPMPALRQSSQKGSFPQACMESGGKLCTWMYVRISSRLFPQMGPEFTPSTDPPGL